MVKKKVPDWLNSSLWSTAPPPPDDDRLHRYSTKPIATTTVEPPPVPVAAPPAPAPAPPPPAPAVVSTVREEPPKPQVIIHNSDSNNNNHRNDDEIDNSAQAQLLPELSKKVINMRELRRIASQGIPDGGGIRSTVWKLLLGYLPPDRGLWSSELAKKRSQYRHFKEELLMNPSEITRKLEKSENDDPRSESSGMLSRSEITHGEHPLSLGKTSIWNQFFQDTEIMEQIDRDVKRTHPDLHFFSGDSPSAKSNQEALKSILTVFAKLNPGIRYVQGMNEILAPLFYVFRNDPDEEFAVHLGHMTLYLTSYNRNLDYIWTSECSMDILMLEYMYEPGVLTHKTLSIQTEKDYTWTSALLAF
ncbi:hypothetical protein Patl1_26041 [Pistacia atlantica]|uniref:Uncharacterized protein n=1 Tax=Pistacia atlantica TaxID=434234 RepID=A0ACC1AZ48_9ROSI|nr:hypothetical protein Patl1_26041 [Pistacia atlantica]